MEEAAKNIDIAVADETTAGSTKAWWYRAKINLLMDADTMFAVNHPKASLEALHSFQKMKETNEPKFKDWADATDYMKILVNSLFNDGVNAYGKKNYHDAFLFFYAVSDASDLLEWRGQKANNETLEKALGNAALCAENDKDYNSAALAYRKEIAITSDAKAYISLIDLLKKQKDNENARKTTDEALAKYPNNKDLLIFKVNFFMNEGKFSDALSFLQQIAVQEPKNLQVQSGIGQAYEQLNDTINALKTYTYMLSIDSNSYEANFAMGKMWFNKSKPVNEQMNTLGSTKEDIRKSDLLKMQRDVFLLKSKPYLQKANAARPGDPEITKALNTIEALTSK